MRAANSTNVTLRFANNTQDTAHDGKIRLVMRFALALRLRVSTTLGNTSWTEPNSKVQ